MTSNDDLMKFLERMEEKREKEKLELVERMEDMKKEVKGAVKSVSDRQDKMEVEQEHIKNDIGVLKSQMEEIKKLVQEPVVQSQGEQHHQEGTQQHQLHVEPGTKSYSKVVEFSAQKKLLEYLPSEVSERQKALDLLDLGRRTVSLHPLQLKDCELEIKRGAKDQNEAKLWAAQTYLRYEMNIKSHILATFTIEDIFVLSENYDTMYVTFSSSIEANTVFSYTKNMRKEAKVGIFVPKEWQDRFKALNTIAYGYRNPIGDQPKFNTRIKWGNSDLVLHRKAPGTKYWTALTINTALPAVDLAAVVQPRMSPAPGRQAREAGKRTRSDSSGPDSPTDLKSNRSRSRSVRSRSESVQINPQPPADSDKGQAVQDPGKVIHEESYCPSSPAPVKNPLIKPSVDSSSPIFKKAVSLSQGMNPFI